MAKYRVQCTNNGAKRCGFMYETNHPKGGSEENTRGQCQVCGYPVIVEKIED